MLAETDLTTVHETGALTFTQNQGSCNGIFRKKEIAGDTANTHTNDGVYEFEPFVYDSTNSEKVTKI